MRTEKEHERNIISQTALYNSKFEIDELDLGTAEKIRTVKKLNDPYFYN